MGFEIDFLPVGLNEKSGDAIALRFGNLHGNRNEQGVIVIDGGFKDDGQKLVDHIKRYYKTDIIDIVIATHPHGDHTAGLETVLTEMDVNEFWMHQPWGVSHINNIAGWFKDGRVTDESVRKALRESLDTIRELENIASQKRIPVIEPFVGLGRDFGFGQVAVAGPGREYYESLLPEFNCTPASSRLSALYEKALDKADEILRKMTKETWEFETLTDSKEEPTTAENNSSVITLLTVDEKNLLFTGDAGIPALTNAANLLEENGITNERYSFLQVPHHGSKRNVGPTILNRLVGPKLAEGQKNRKRMAAFCSCAVHGEPKHPSKKVANAFRRRGAFVFITQEERITHYCNSQRQYSQIVEVPFYNEVE